MSTASRYQSAGKVGRRSLAGWLLLFGKGVVMGMGDSVPGVSGGTIAVITRIYGELIHSIKSVDAAALGFLRRGSLGAAWGHVNGGFLSVLAVGLLSGLLVSAHTVLYLLEHHFQILMGFFIGLVLASSWILGRPLAWGRLRHWLVAAAGALLVAGIGQLPPLTVQPAADALFLLYLFGAGAVAISAMLLPGLSGAFILILLGAYETALRALTELQWLNIIVFAAGCGSGLLCFSRVLDWLLRTHRQLSYCFIVGLLLGSVAVLWPWQERYQVQTGDDPQLLLTAAALLGGLGLVFLLDRLSSARNLADHGAA